MLQQLSLIHHHAVNHFHLFYTFQHTKVGTGGFEQTVCFVGGAASALQLSDVILQFADALLIAIEAVVATS